MVWGRITATVVATGINSTTGDALGTCLKVRDNRTTMAFEAKQIQFELNEGLNHFPYNNSFQVGFTPQFANGC